MLGKLSRSHEASLMECHQRHFRQSEHWYVVSGKAVVTRNSEKIVLTSGCAVDLPVQTWHRIRNPDPENMVFIEVQTGDYFGEMAGSKKLF